MDQVEQQRIVIGEAYALEIFNTSDKHVVEIWRVLERYPTGKDTVHSSLRPVESRDLPLSVEEARDLVAQTISDVDPETQKSVSEALSAA